MVVLKTRDGVIVGSVMNNAIPLPCGDCGQDDSGYVLVTGEISACTNKSVARMFEPKSRKLKCIR